MNNLIKYLFFLIVTTMVFSCQNRPSEVLSRKKMENLMYDMYIAEAIIDNDYQEFIEPEKKEALIAQVLKKHKTTEAHWDTSLSWYSDNIDVYIQINDSVKVRLKRNQTAIDELIEQKATKNIIDESKLPGYIPRHFRIAGLGCDRGFKFRLDSTQLAERFNDNDSIFFRLNLLGIYPLGSYSLKSMLKVNYADTTIYETSKLSENRSYSFIIRRAVNQDTVRSVDGFVNLVGKFPQIPIQLYEISLGQKELEVSMQDSIKEFDEKETERLLHKPQMVKD